MWETDRYRSEVVWSAAAALVGALAWAARCLYFPSAEQSAAVIRPPVDLFILGVASIIGLTIGLSLPFFIELTRIDIPTSMLHHGTTKKFLHGTKFDERLVEEVVLREELTVNCLGDRQFEIPITATTTCGEVVTELKQMLDLSTSLNEYGLFVRQVGKTDSYMANEIPVHSVMVNYETSKKDSKGDRQERGKEDGDGSRLTSGSSTGTSRHYHFVFNIFSFACLSTTKFSLVEEDFLFERAMDSVLLRRLPCSPHTMLRLASLRCQCLFGDARVGGDVPASPSVHAVQVDGMYRAPVFESRAAPKAKRRGGKSKGAVAAVSGGSRRLTAAEISTTMREVATMWHSLRGLSSDDARRAFMGIVDEWSYSMHSVFDIHQKHYPDWPKDVWLLVGPESISFHEKYNRTSLVALALEDIEEFGGPYPNVYTIVTSGKQIDFETRHVQEIAAVMKSYCEQLSVLYQTADQSSPSK
eukprot:m.174634 g.174634  ORF g.174634 m.174634 type:complete len:471 (+) comp24361_c0_seq1:48-1460(+)